ncbi:damage-control phosphatase ARMT1-like [Diprion similis]|uniref:damage-control phosphatase ARMT1-like n=1 Tax=Diprion similis TaxID=362088 RepID=UPI001EF7B340|nr:damage-control phosphatase ARMT1-like [Diprion similis]
MTERQNSLEGITDLQDTVTPFGVQLRGKYKRTGAYAAFNDRVPVILTRVIDSLSRDKDEIVKKYGKLSGEDVKQVIGYISKLKNEIVTNKPFIPLVCLPDGSSEDLKNIKMWNDYLEERTKIEGKVPAWYNTVALYAECYAYRRVTEGFKLTKTLRSYDPFAKQKEESFDGSVASAIAVANYTLSQVERAQQASSAELKHELAKFLRLSLWGNRCDLSLSGGAENGQIGNPLELLNALEKDVLVDDTNFVWDVLVKAQKNGGLVLVDIVLDNAGYELFTDLCLATFLTAHKIAKKIRIYVKDLPWFISDVTTNDFHWMIERMIELSNPDLNQLGKLIKSYLESGAWSVEKDAFWTSPFPFLEMSQKDPALYAKLSEANLLVIKGDLNYRKLTGDVNWEYSTNFLEATKGFSPTNFVSLRSIKSNTCAGLKSEQGQYLDKTDPNWMLSGQYGLIQGTIDACICSKTSS